jgi:hypothetical protein
MFEQTFKNIDDILQRGWVVGVVGLWSKPLGFCF